MCKLKAQYYFYRSRLEKAKKEQEDRLEYVKEQLDICSHDAKRRIKEITAKVEGQVSHRVYQAYFHKPFHFLTNGVICCPPGD